jgi:hypothetical protein
MSGATTALESNNHAGVATMGGPIVRSGPSPTFSQNWDSVFGKSAGKKTAAAKPKKSAKASAKAKAARPAKKAAKKGKKK